MITKEKQPSKGRIIIVTNCGNCPYHTYEETDNGGYLYCWTLMRTINDSSDVLDECPLEEVDMEWEDEYVD